jgi:hypothetical protein
MLAIITHMYNNNLTLMKVVSRLDHVPNVRGNVLR